jgi:hypothetical protein
MGKQAGAPAVRAPVNMFIFYVEDTDIRASTVGELKTTFSVIETDEGGINTIADQTVNRFKAEAVPVSRPLTKDRLIEDWYSNQLRGIEDKRDCYFVQLDTAGNQLYRWTLSDCVIGEKMHVKGDAKAGDQEQMETFTLKPTTVSEREDLQ